MNGQGYSICNIPVHFTPLNFPFDMTNLKHYTEHVHRKIISNI